MKHIYRLHGSSQSELLYLLIINPSLFMAVVLKNWSANAGDIRDMVWITGSRKCLGGGNESPLQYSCLENSMDRGAWLATVHGVSKSRTQLSNFHLFHFIFLWEAEKYRMLRTGALGWPRGMVQGRRWEGGSGRGTRVYPWWIHVDVWQNQYNIVK